MKIFVIIPVHNEEEKLNEIIDSLRRIVTFQISVLVIDDFSTDSSKLILKRNNVLSVRNKYEKGRDGAIKTGLTFYEHYCNFDWVVTFDGDGQHPKEFISYLNNQQNIILKGNRFSEFSTQYYTPIDRIKLAQDVSQIVYNKFKLNIEDPNCGLLAFPANLVPWIIENCSFVRHCALEICIKLLNEHPKNIKLIEKPIPAIYFGSKKIEKKYLQCKAEARYNLRYNSLNQFLKNEI